jgi:hypothetical protein
MSQASEMRLFLISTVNIYKKQYEFASNLDRSIFETPLNTNNYKQKNNERRFKTRMWNSIS